MVSDGWVSNQGTGMMRQRLETLRVGDHGTVAGIKTTREVAKRLADLGFISGATLEMVRPGRPCIVRIGDALVGLGAHHQSGIVLRHPATC